MKPLTDLQIAAVRGAMQTCIAVGAPTGELQRWLHERENAREVRVITPVDRAWPLLAACSMEEHLSPDGRPFLSCAMVAGRAYRLTAEQRSVITEWFNMTCSQEVMVEMLVYFTEEPTIVREVVIRSEQHVDPANLRLLNGPRKITIDKWGEFCSAVAHRKVENEQRREVDALVARVAKLLKTAKESGVEHRLRGPGDVAHEWHARIQQRKVENGPGVELDAGVSRDILRDILAVRNEHALVALVKEPARITPTNEFAGMDELFEQLGVTVNQTK